MEKKQPQISIVTAIYNGLSVNKVFLESIRKYTELPFELIIIDNLSDDGSREFFLEAGAIVIENKANYAYAYCQNQGIRASSADMLFFLNNDIVVSPGWDRKMIHIAGENNLDILSAAAIDNLGTTREETMALRRRWRRIKNTLLILGHYPKNYKRMLRLMYRDWEKFCTERFELYGDSVVEGVAGCNIMMTRRAINLLGGWDEQLQASDFDLFITAKKRAEVHRDIKAPHIARGIYIHHFTRMTFKYGSKKFPPFANSHQLIDLTSKWTPEEIDKFHPDNATLRKNTR